MPKYLFRCGTCGKTYSRFKRVENRDEPEYCARTGCQQRLERIFSASFQIIGQREADKPENDMYRVFTNNGTQADRLEMMRKDAKAADEENAKLAAIGKAKLTTVADIVGPMGLAEAARSGEVGIRNWREANIPKEESFATD